MATLLTADGRLLRSQAPAIATASNQGLWPAAFPPMWSDGERYPNGLTDGLASGTGPTVLVSFEAIYRSQPVVRAVVDKLSRRIATLPFTAFRVQPDQTRVRDFDSSLATLIRRPMPRMATVHLNQYVAQSLLLHGNALVAKVRGNDREMPPEMLWPLDWAKVSAYAPTGGRIEWWSTTQFTENNGDDPRYLRAEDTIHFAWSAPSGGEVGVSPLESLGVTLRIEDAAQRHQSASFRHGNRPSLAITVAEDLSPDQRDLFRQSIEGMHKGADNTGKTLFLSNGATVETLSMTPVEAELIEQRKLSREEIGMVYDLAGPLMNDLTHGTYSNVQELTKGLYRDVIPPWTELIVQTEQAQLIDPEPAWLDRMVRFDFSDKLRGDPVEQAQVDKSDVEAGIKTRDEARDGRGLAAKGGPAAELTANTNNQSSLDSLDSTAGGDGTVE